MTCTTYVKIRKILRRATEILIICENIKEANAEMEESAEKKIPKGRKRKGKRGAVPFADRPRPFPLSTKRSDFFFDFSR